jgi:Ca-activated chloride channel homolog
VRFSRTSRVQRSLAEWAICSLFLCHVAGDGPLARTFVNPHSSTVAGAKLHIVAVRDSQLLTLCPTKWIEPKPGRPLATTPRDGDVVITKSIGPASGWMRVTVWQTGENATLPVSLADGYALPLDLDHGLLTPDAALASALRDEISKAGGFSVVDSLDDAEYVLLVEAHHVALAYFAGPGGAIQSRGDREGNFREALLGLLVPASAYREHGPSIAVLLPASRWRGASVAYSPTPSSGALLRRFPASVESFARYLQGTSTRHASFPPVCAASAAPARPSGDEAVRSPIGLREDVLLAAAPTPRVRTTAAFRGGVTYVSVPVVVRDPAGRVVAGLSASDFRLYEEDVSQPIERLIPTSAPVTLGLVVDTSGSMRDEWSRLHKALLRFIATLQPADRVLLASFDTRVRLHAEAGVDREQVRQALGRIDSRSGTRLYDAVALLVGTRMQASMERQALVLLTDGVDTRSRVADAQSTLRLIGESHVPVYAIQYDTRRRDYPLPWATRVTGKGIRDMTPLILPEGALDNAELFARADAYLASLTEMSGGRLYRAESLPDLNQAFTQIVRDLGEQYTLGYYPTNQTRDGSYRPLRVEVNRADVTVTARPGYRAPSQ